MAIPRRVRGWPAFRERSIRFIENVEQVSLTDAAGVDLLHDYITVQSSPWPAGMVSPVNINTPGTPSSVSSIAVSDLPKQRPPPSFKLPLRDLGTVIPGISCDLGALVREDQHNLINNDARRRHGRSPPTLWPFDDLNDYCTHQRTTVDVPRVVDGSWAWRGGYCLLRPHVEVHTPATFW